MPSEQTYICQQKTDQVKKKCPARECYHMNEHRRNRTCIPEGDPRFCGPCIPVVQEQ